MKFIFSKTKSLIFWAAVTVLLFILVSNFFHRLQPVLPATSQKIFEINPGEGFNEIVVSLTEEKIIRSPLAFKIYAIASGSAGSIKPGIYRLSGSMSSPRILGIISEQGKDIEVTVPDGASIYDIDALLAKNQVLPAGFLISYAKHSDLDFEGMLYPDTYKFSENSPAKAVVDKFLQNFRAKAEPALNKDPINYKKNLILASLLQKEISDENDAKIVAGILKKRLDRGWSLDVDATICYLKKIIKNQANCYPLAPSDFKIDSPYNTYLYTKLPSGPIGSPNIDSINAVLDSVSSPYWFYLSDPKTGRTIFSKTLDEQNANRIKYLR